MASHVYKSNERFSMILGFFYVTHWHIVYRHSCYVKKKKIFFPRNGFSKHQSTSTSSYQRHVCKKRIVTTFDGLQNQFIYFLTLRANSKEMFCWSAYIFVIEKNPVKCTCIAPENMFLGYLGWQALIITLGISPMIFVYT